MTTSPDPALAGLLLSGGASSRFGAPKAQALLAGKSLAQITLDRLATTCATIAIAGARHHSCEDHVNLPDPPDLPHGPLAGILTGLEWAHANRAQWLIVSPCDMPLLPKSIHRDLVNAAQTAKAPLTILSGDDGPNPLCSVWSPHLAPSVRQRLTREHPPIWRYAEELGATSLRLNDPAMTLNINTPQDLQRATAFAGYHWWREGQDPKN